MQNERRQFLKGAVAAAAAMGLEANAQPAPSPPPLTPSPRRKFTICLSCRPGGGPDAPPARGESPRPPSCAPAAAPDAPALATGGARRFGFESIEPSPSFIAKLSD